MSGKQLSTALVLVLLTVLGYAYSAVLFWAAVVLGIIGVGTLATLGLARMNDELDQDSF